MDDLEATKYFIHPSTSAGVVSLKTFTEINKHIKEDDVLKSYGLTNREIEIYRHHLKGAEFLETKYKNLEISALNNILSNIYGKISKGQSGCISSEDDDSNAKYSLDPQFQITEKPKQNFLHPDHPLNSLDILTNDLFGHLNNDSTPSASKQRKLVRRYERKFNKPISIPEPKCFSSVKKNVSEEKNSHSYNEFIKAIECSNSLKSSECSKDQQIRNPNSKWDVKTVENKKLSPNQKSSTSKNVLKICKTKEQTEKALYTVKNNKIVRLIKNTETKFDEAKFTTCEITIPQNEAEKRLLEGTKLSVDEIKTLPKFGNYTPGIPTKVLYVKNLSNAVTYNDLFGIFKNCQKLCDIKLLSGKMRGQAFISFADILQAEISLHEKNGTILKGKPMIIQFGKKDNG